MVGRKRRKRISGGTIYLLKDDLSGFAESHAVKLENPDHNPICTIRFLA